MATRVKKRGNSLALRIPRSLARAVGLEGESLIEPVVEDSKLSICPLLAQNSPSISFWHRLP